MVSFTRSRRVADQGRELLGQFQEPRDGLLGGDPVVAEDGLEVARSSPPARRMTSASRRSGVGQEDGADALPLVLALVAGPDAAAGGADLARRPAGLAELVQEGVVGQEEVGAVGDAQARRRQMPDSFRERDLLRRGPPGPRRCRCR